MAINHRGSHEALSGCAVVLAALARRHWRCDDAHRAATQIPSQAGPAALSGKFLLPRTRK
jgi:hypothetical protein